MEVSPLPVERRLGRHAGDQGDEVLLVIRRVWDRDGKEVIVIGAHVDGIREASRWEVPRAGLSESVANSILARLETLATMALVSALGGIQQSL